MTPPGGNHTTVLGRTISGLLYVFVDATVGWFQNVNFCPLTVDRVASDRDVAMSCEFADSGIQQVRFYRLLRKFKCVNKRRIALTGFLTEKEDHPLNFFTDQRLRTAPEVDQIIGAQNDLFWVWSQAVSDDIWKLGPMRSV